jgi:uncharacterized cupredoxin-like copper-binding protein
VNALRIALTWVFGFPLAALTFSHGALGHDATHAPKPVAQPMVQTDFGRTGDPKRISRTVRVDMADAMRFAPASLEVRQGDTVRFIVTNSGKQPHEMVLGTLPSLQAHAELMRKHPGMNHDEPYLAHAAPGATAEIVWQFTRAGEFHYGCLVPGHFEAGMVGRIRVAPR